VEVKHQADYMSAGVGLKEKNGGEKYTGKPANPREQCVEEMTRPHLRQLGTNPLRRIKGGSKVQLRFQNYGSLRNIGGRRVKTPGQIMDTTPLHRRVTSSSKA